jgi:hypothetical protein
LVSEKIQLWKWDFGELIKLRVDPFLVEKVDKIKEIVF